MQALLESFYYNRVTMRYILARDYYKYTMGRNQINVTAVGKFSNKMLTLTIIMQHTLERNHINVATMRNVFHESVAFFDRYIFIHWGPFTVPFLSQNKASVSYVLWLTQITYRPMLLFSHSFHIFRSRKMRMVQGDDAMHHRLTDALNIDTTQQNFACIVKCFNSQF